MTAVRTALRRATPGDLVVCLRRRRHRRLPRGDGRRRPVAGGTAFADPGELEAPDG